MDQLMDHVFGRSTVLQRADQDMVGRIFEGPKLKRPQLNKMAGFKLNISSGG